MRIRRRLAALLLASAPTGAAGAAETVTYSYDALGRLTATSTSGTVNHGVATEIRYDAAGNRSSYTVAGGTGAPAPPVEPPPSGGGGPAATASFAVGDSSASEGGTLVFTIVKSGGAAASVAYATADGGAEAPGDYQPAGGTLAFAAEETSKTVPVASLDDSLDENAETFTLNLSAASAGASIADGQGIGTIADNDDPAPAGNIPPTATNNIGSQPKCSTGTYDVVGDDTDADGDIPLVLAEVSGTGFFAVSTTEIMFNSTSSTGWKTANYKVRDARDALSGIATLKINVAGGSCDGQQAAPPPPPPGKIGR